jgi:GNAT superfamily N-acetyltransferase
MYETHVLRLDEAEWYAHFASVSHQAVLHQGSQDTLAVGATIFGTPVGLALARVEGVAARLLSLVVAPGSRRLGIGTGLLREVQGQVLARNGRVVYTILNPEDPAYAVALRFLEKEGWSAPIPRALVCWSDAEAIYKAPWLYSCRPLLDGYDVFPWAELTEAERSSLHSQCGHLYPEWLGPFTHEPFEPINSLGLRHDGQVIGWMVTHRVGPNTVRYSKLFLAPPHQRAARGIALVAEAILLQLASGVSQAILDIDANNEPMMRFARRHLAPFMTRMTETQVSMKPLTSSAAFSPTPAETAGRASA